jgi:molybdate transport system substrate-binding protein
VEALRRTLLAAKTIAVPGSTSGIFLTDKVFPELGIADRIRVKVTERGTQATAMVAAGEADIALMPVSELMHVPGLEVVGRLPDAVQLIQVFAAALVVGSKESDAGSKLIRFLASGKASAAIESNGMELVAGRGGN